MCAYMEIKIMKQELAILLSLTEAKQLHDGVSEKATLKERFKLDLEGLLKWKYITKEAVTLSKKLT